MAEQIISKTCRVCNETKPISEFPRRADSKDGHRNDCKICQSKHKREYHKKYSQTERGKAVARKAKKRYYQTKKGKVAKRKDDIRYRATEKGKVTFHRAYIHQKIRHPERIKAVSTVNHAIRDGKLPRPDTLQCHYCGTKAKEYHHHKGYAPEHRLDVVPVCVFCHKHLHQTPNC